MLSVRREASTKLNAAEALFRVNNAGKMAAKGQQRDIYVRVTSRNHRLAHMTDFYVTMD